MHIMTEVQRNILNYHLCFEGVVNQPGFGFIAQNPCRVRKFCPKILNRKHKEQKEKRIILLLGSEELNELSKPCWTLQEEVRLGARLLLS